ncbi:glycosyltransferase family 4 protein [Bifidobacterium favimelis]|uniref:Glycosyltransferase family 4 protein n=1 Tax=Bifidobacterium favimelis TaxID=3122979 RepID=A0ABU8ZKY9_9BIFI
MKTVAFIINDVSGAGGTERVATRIANQLAAEREFRIIFISLYERRSPVFYDISDDVKHVSIYPEEKHGVWRYFLTCYRIRHFLRDYSVDIAIDVDCIFDLYTLPAAAGLSTKVISWEHFNFNQNPQVPYRKIARRLAARYADAIVTLTEEDQRLYKGNLSLRCPIVTIRNPMQSMSTRPEYDKTSTNLLSVGRLTSQKGFDLLVQIAALVLPGNPDWHWQILGEGEDRDLLEGQVIRAGLEKQVSFLGNRENVDDFYKKAAIFVLTSRYEGLPMVLLEAKAHRLPIVSFNCETGPAEIVDDGRNGFLIDGFDCNAMAGKLEELMRSQAKRQEFSSAAGLHSDRFDIDKIVTAWKKLFERLD